MKPRGRAPERRQRSAGLGAHPERRAVAQERREALRRPAAGDRGRAVVLPPIVNMFERADSSSPVVRQATLGACVGLLASARGYDLAETADRYRGWIRSAALRRLSPRGAIYPRPDRACRVKSFMCQIYTERDVTTRAPIATAPLLALLEVLEERGEWKRVRLPDGRRGWTQSGDLEPAVAKTPPAGPSAVDGAAVAAAALRFLGLPYVWGGTTPFGLDCSGLSQLVYRLHGYLLPRDSDLQFDDPNLDSVERADLRPGDLVFFGPNDTSISHVGVSLDRDEFVSATTFCSPTVHVDRLDDPYWKRLYRGARRLARGG